MKQCKICGQRFKLLEFKGTYICKACIKLIKQQTNNEQKLEMSGS